MIRYEKKGIAMKKECKHHGITEYVKRKDGYYDCKQCRVDSVARRRRKVREKAIAFLGGKCEKCGYNKYNGALEFHHINPLDKTFELKISKMGQSWETVKKEAEKCMLLCANCHREIHQTIVD